MDRFFLIFILIQLKQQFTRFAVLAVFCCTVVTSVAQERPIGKKGESEQNLKLEANWQEQLFVAYFDTIPRIAVDSHPSRFAMSPVQYKKLQADSISLFKGIRELQKGDTRKAISYLQKSAEGVEGLWYNNSNWYLGLAFLRLNELDIAEYLIDEIAEMEIQPYQLLAAELYKQIIAKKIQTTK